MNRSSRARRRVRLDFEVDFSNDGTLHGRDFLLDLDGDDIDESALGGRLSHELRVRSVDCVRILSKQVIAEPIERMSEPLCGVSRADRCVIDLSHTIENGLITYKGLPAPIVCDYLSREQSRAQYAEGTTFQIGHISMVANTGTYIDSPFHRFSHGADIAELDLARLADVDAVVVRVADTAARAIPHSAFFPYDVRDKAVLVQTGWDVHWRADRYFEGHPFLTADAAAYLKEAGALLVGIDSFNIDDTHDKQRPVHTTLLGAGIPIIEHLCGLDRLPDSAFTFSAVPVKIKGMGTFPVRAYATVGVMHGAR